MRWSELLFQAPCGSQQDTGLYICFGLLKLLLKEERKHTGPDYGAPLHRLWLSRVNPILLEQWNMLDSTSTKLLQYQLRTLSQTKFSMNRPHGVTMKKYYVDYDEFSSIDLVFLRGEITLENGFPKSHLKAGSQLGHECLKLRSFKSTSEQFFREVFCYPQTHMSRCKPLTQALDQPPEPLF